MTITVDVGDGRIVEFPDAETANQFFAGQNQVAAEPEKGMVESVVDWFRGVNRREDIPQAISAKLGLPPEKSAQMTALLATTASDDRLQRGISEIEPEAQFDKDEFGNLIAVVPVRDDEGNVTGRTRFYPNPRGLDMADVMQGAGAVAAATGIGKAAKFLGLPFTGVLGGATLGGTEAALTELASSQLTDSPYQFSDIPYGAAGGAAGGLLERAGGAVYRRLFKPADAVMTPSGQFTPQVQQALRQAGVDPDTATKEMAQDVLGRIQQAVDPEEAARLAAAQSLPVPVPMTRGQVTGSKGQQLFEDAARAGAYGQVAESMLAGQQAAQQQAIRQNIPEIQRRIAQEAPFLGQAGEGGEAAQVALAARREAERKAASALYTKARESGPAMLMGQAKENIFESAKSALETFNPRTAPNAYGFLDDLEQELARGDVAKLFQWREQATKAARGSDPDATALRGVINQFDRSMSDAVDRSLMAGDDAAVQRWKDAISNYKKFSDVWKSQGGILSKLTEKTMRDGRMVLKQDPASVSNYLFGAGGTKLVSQPALARDLLTMKRQLPEQEWNMLRQEAFLKLMRFGEGAFQDGERMYSGVKFKKTLQDMMDTNPTVVKALFTPQEVGLLKQFANVSAAATGGAINASNSANSAANMFQKLVGMVGSTNLAQFASRAIGVSWLRSAYGGTRAFSSLQDLTTAPSATGIGAGAGGALLSGEEAQRPVSEQIKRTTGLSFGAQ
jgi:hypothetical protein